MTHYKKEFADRFSKKTDQELINAFNGEVGNNGRCTARGYYLHALRNEMENRDFDVSLVIKGDSTYYNRKVKIVNKKLVFVENSM